MECVVSPRLLTGVIVSVHPVVCLKLLQLVIGELVKRYVMMNLRRDNDEGVTEDDVDEIKHDISALRYELLDGYYTIKMFNKLSTTFPL